MLLRFNSELDYVLLGPAWDSAKAEGRMTPELVTILWKMSPAVFCRPAACSQINLELVLQKECVWKGLSGNKKTDVDPTFDGIVEKLWGT